MAEFSPAANVADLAAIAQMNPSTAVGQQQIRQCCLAAAQGFLAEAEGASSRQHPDTAHWVAVFLAEGVLQGMAASPAELRGEDAEEILLYVLPADPRVAAADADEVVTVLQDVWRYLGRVYKFPNAGLVAGTLGRLRGRFAQVLASGEGHSHTEDQARQAQQQAQDNTLQAEVCGSQFSALNTANALRKRKRKLAREARKAHKKKK